MYWFYVVGGFVFRLLYWSEIGYVSGEWIGIFFWCGYWMRLEIFLGVDECSGWRLVCGYFFCCVVFSYYMVFICVLYWWEICVIIVRSLIEGGRNFGL